MKSSKILLPILMFAFVILFPRFAKADATSSQEHITLTIRGSSATAVYQNLALSDASAADVLVTPTSGGAGIAISPRTVLGVLETLQPSTTDFSITDLSYSSAYNSFLINCIAMPSGASTPDCYNWNDAINGAYPQVGVDQQTLNDGDIVYLFFGSPRKTVLPANSVTAGQPFTAIARQYDLPTGSYKPLSGVTLGVGTQNPDFSFTELATSTVDANGQAAFTLNATGTFAVGIKEDYYFPSVPITITAATTTPSATTTPPTAPQSGGGGGGGGISHSFFNIPNALTFISGNQNADGSFDSPYSTDWTALAFSAADPGVAKTKLRDFLLNTKPQLASVTDYERHAMALEALGINPYSGTAINYIAAITNAFDGIQIGTSADNDDIFALPPLERAGFTTSDIIIQKEAAFILAAQLPDGSWDESPDMTAAAIQALIPLSDISGVSGALGKANKYLASIQSQGGGWGNVDSTSWVQTAINANIEARTPNFETQSAWTSSSGLFPTDALASAQQQDGGVKSANRVWSTSYAVVAASGKSWTTILNSFPKPISSNSGAEVLGASTSTADSLTTPAATTTPETATSTSLGINPVIGTTTPAVVTFAPKPKTRKPQIKENTQTVLGETITDVSSGQSAAVNDSSQTGFFGRVWHAIISFLWRIF